MTTSRSRHTDTGPIPKAPPGPANPTDRGAADLLSTRNEKPRLAQGRDQEGEESHEGSLFTSVYAAKEEDGSDMKRAPRLRGSVSGPVNSVRLI